MCFLVENQAVNRIGNWFNKMAFKQITGRRPGKKAVQLLPAILHGALTAYFLVLPNTPSLCILLPHIPHTAQAISVPLLIQSRPGRHWACIWRLRSWLELGLGMKVSRANMGQEMQLWLQHCGNLHVGLGNAAARPAHTWSSFHGLVKLPRGCSVN